ncbi:MAG: hypothetical protein GKS06_08410 [Acidobacteria bacterium]|nr:hypothetical protein [Acidobacteriota bacterium]
MLVSRTLVSRVSCALVLLLAGAQGVARAQESRAALTAAQRQAAAAAASTDPDRAFVAAATFTNTRPQIDGRLDDAAWRVAIPITEFVQSQPNEGAPATERSEVRVLYDAEYLYISAMLWDSEPDQMVATVLRRDESHDDNDAFAVTLDTYHDHRNGFFFETNAHGALFDAQIIGEGGTSGPGGGSGSTFNDDWDASWEAAGEMTDEVQLEFRSDQSRVVWVSALYTWGSFWDGRKKNWEFGSGFRLGARFNAAVSVNLNDITLSGGAFKTTLVSSRLAYDFNTKLALSGLFQYDNLTDQFLSNVRLRYNYEPLSDIFLVYNESRLTENPALIDRALILKITKLFRL